MWITSQDNPTIEIIHSEETSLNGLCPIEFFILNRGQAFRGREEISLLMHVCHSILYFLFFFLFFPFCYLDSFPLFSFLFNACSCGAMVMVHDSPRGCYRVALQLCTARALYILPAMTSFTILAFNYFCLVQGVHLDHPLVCQLSSHHHLPMLVASLPITRQKRLFCLLAHHGILSCYPSWHAPSGSNSSSLFWVVCYPSRTFALKKFEREPQNRLSFLPTTKPYPLLPLTHDPPLLYWLGTGWQCLGFVHAPLPMYAKSLSTAHAFAMVWRLVYAFYCSFLTFYGMNCLLIFHSLLAFSFQGLGLA